MNKKKVMMITVSAIVAVCLYIFYNENNVQDYPQEDSATEEQNQSTEEESTDIEEEQTEDQEQNSSSGIRETVTGVVKEALRIFQKDTHIVAIGDSLTQGVGDETGNGGYIGILEERLRNENQKVTIDNFGKRGNRTDQLLKRLESEEIIQSLGKADIVLITIGSNDIMKIVKDNFMHLTEEPFQQERQPYRQRLEQILSTITSIQPEAEIYLLGLFNPFEKYFRDIQALDNILNRWNEEGRQASFQYEQVTFVPLQGIYNEQTENVFADDNFHPNHSGYEMIANRVLTYLQNDD
ncbi:SGNH/GDSL hydrolase family protein [Gracilibacillus sp. YIM 98692]|uniref:SGNH/GDSL hydrolase family protein n=1 Tax=Gracilibacillus sp. YIM 98692 TaxID=2663532 RepID=UPI0013D88BD9|nr:SGNH/GDSL hydrolase family protein [Gracilibacillus sp. YIM 98692]